MHVLKKASFYLTLLQLTSLIIMTIFLKPTAAETLSEPDRQLLILGDSLSAAYGVAQDKSWVSLLQQRFERKNIKLRIINASISGDTTANGLNRLPDALAQYQPRYLLIELGANDGLRGLPLSLIKSNLKQLITLGQQQRAQVLLMSIRIPPNYGKKYTEKFTALYEQLAKETDIVLLPFMLNDIAIHPKLMQTDRLHPNETAQPLIMEHIWKALKPVIFSDPSPALPQDS